MLVLRLSRGVIVRRNPFQSKGRWEWNSKMKPRWYTFDVRISSSTRRKHAPASWLVVLVSFWTYSIVEDDVCTGVDLRWARLRYCFDPWSRGPLYSRISKWILPLPTRNQLPKFFVRDVEIIEWHWSELAGDKMMTDKGRGGECQARGRAAGSENRARVSP